MQQNNYVIIMAGGIGSRFWPYSRSRHPKQFQDILGTGETLIQQTAQRFFDICPKENIYVVTNSIYKDLVKEQLPFMAEEQILLEPVMRNTAPCIAYAAYKIHKKNTDANLLITPADHLMTKPQAFEKVALAGLDYTSSNDSIVTIGVTPNRPDTGYGYIQYDTSKSDGQDILAVSQFREKPDLETAKSFLEAGNFLWNAGIFIWNAKTVIACFQKFLPAMHEAFSSLHEHYYEPDEAHSLNKVYESCDSISIDYGIMERADNVFVVPCDCGWSDLGTWKSLFEVSEKDEQGNVLQGNIMNYGSNNCLVKIPEDRLVVVQGLENYIVVEKDNVLLICDKDQEQRIKSFLSDVKAQKDSKYY